MKKWFAIGIILLFVGTSIIPLADGLPIEKEHILVPESCSDDINITISGCLGKNGWYVSVVMVTLSYKNDLFVRVDNGNWTLYIVPFFISSDGIHLIEATDDFEHIVNATVKIDKTSPVVAKFTVKRDFLFTWKLTADVYDNTSGVNEVWFYIDNLWLNDTSPPYGIYWTGLMFLVCWKFNIFGDFYSLPGCVPYDNAGNSIMQNP
jgi:hypothetical protein